MQHLAKWWAAFIAFIVKGATAVGRGAAALWRRLGRRWWLAVMGLVVIGAIVGVALTRRPKTQESTEFTNIVPVTRGDLTAAVSTTGEVYAPRAAELSFDVTKIELIEVNVKAGQQVKAGDVLARIDPTTLERAVTQAEADLVEAQDALEEAREPYTELDLAQARLKVSQAELALADAQKKLEEAREPYTELDVIEARVAVTQAQTALDEALEDQKNLLTPDIAAAQAAVRDAEVSLKNAKSQLELEQKDTSSAAQIRTLEYEAKWFADNYAAAQVKFTQGKIDKDKLDLEYSNMLAAQEKLDRARISAESGLLSAQNQLAQAQEKYDQAVKDLADLRNGPDRVELGQAQSKVAQAEYNLAKAKADLEDIEDGPDPLEITRAETELAQAEYNLAKAKDDLKEIEDGPDEKDLRIAQSRADAAQATLDEAQAALEAATMVAPYDATIVSVGAEVGDLVSSGTVVIKLADLSNLRVKAIVDEIDVSQIKIGQEAEITFDAFPGRRYKGQVLEVPLQGTLSDNVLTYEVLVSLEGERTSLNPGMTANVNIVTAHRRDVLLVPALAIQIGEEGNVVQIAGVGQGAQYKPVTVGATDGTYTEIVEGLEEGEKVVVTYQSEDESQMGFRSMGMGGAVMMRSSAPRRNR